MIISNLFIHQSGSPKNPTVLFLHGSPLSGRMWQPQMDSLSEYHCLAPDLPEHGLSKDIRFDMPDTIQRLAKLIRESSASGRVHVVGLSFGGVVAQALLSQSPELVDSVLLSGTAARSGKAFQNFLKLYLDLNKPFMKLLPPSWIAGLFQWQFGIPEQYLPQMTADMRLVNGESLSRLIHSTYADIQTPEQATRPVLVVVGSKETPTAQSMARRLKTTIQGAQGVVAPGGTHVWNMQQPALFNRLLRAWLKGEPLPAEFKPFRS